MLGALAILPFSPLLLAAPTKTNDADLVALGEELDELVARIAAVNGNSNTDREILEVLFERLDILERRIFQYTARPLGADSRLTLLAGL